MVIEKLLQLFIRVINTQLLKTIRLPLVFPNIIQDGQP